MSVSATPLAPPDLTELVSPELALVDPVLRRRLQALAPTPPPLHQAPPRVARAAGSAGGDTPEEALRTADEPRTTHISFGRVRLGGIALASCIAFVLGAKLAGPADLTATQATPSASAAQLSPPNDLRAAVDRSVQRLAWAPVAGATGYEVAFYKGGDRVFHSQTPRPWVDLSGAVRQALPPGSLTWYVWPTRCGLRDATPVVRSQLSLNP